MYKYLPIEQAKVGDVVEAVETVYNVTKGNLYVILPNASNNSIGHFINDKGEHTDVIYLLSEYWKLVATKPGSKAEIGDTVKSITGLDQIFTVTSSTSTHLQPGNWRRDCVVVLRKADEPEQQPTTRRNLAFYKRSGKPWTQEEHAAVISYTEGPTVNNYGLFRQFRKLRYIFDNADSSGFQYLWANQETHPNFKNCKQVAYEDIFPSQRVAVVTGDVNGHPVGSRIVQARAYYKIKQWRESRRSGTSLIRS